MRELTAQEMSRLAELHLTESDLAVHWDLHPEESFETAANYLADLRQKLGVQEEQPEVVTVDGQAPVSTPVTELPESDPQHVAVGENGWPVAETVDGPVEVIGENPDGTLNAAEIPSAGLSELPATQE